MNTLRIKKAVIAVIVLILITLLANTAFGKEDSLSQNYTANTNLIDVKIVEKSKDCKCANQTSRITDAVSSIEENLCDLTPGSTTVLSYKIVNQGCIDVLLDGVYIAVDTNQLNDYINFKWTVTQYEDDKPVNTIVSDSTGKCLSKISSSGNLSSNNIVLRQSGAKGNYCMLELEITYSEDSPEQSQALEAVFTITPSFIQN